MDFRAFLAQFTTKQRLAALVAIGAIIAGAAYYVTLPQTAVAPPPGTTAPGSVTVKPVMPKGYQPGVALRDPFALPETQQPVSAAQPTGAIAPASSPQPGNKAQAARPVLTGVVAGGSAKAAIIRYGGESRSYQVNEFIGPYQLLAVYEDSVTLWGPDGKLVLTVGKE